MTDTEVTLVAERVIAGYLPGVDILNGVNLTLGTGELVGIIGPNGAGKSTLVKAIFGLVGISAGTVALRGESITDLAAHELVARGVGYVPQRENVFQTLTVEENLRLPFTLFVHRQRRFCHETVLTQLRQINRTETFLDRSSRDLSGGEAQIVALLRAIQLQPTLLLLDESTGALDDQATRMIEQLVNGWFEQLPAERALVWVTHDKRQVARIANETITMNEGKLSAIPDPWQEWTT